MELLDRLLKRGEYKVWKYPHKPYDDWIWIKCKVCKVERLDSRCMPFNFTPCKRCGGDWEKMPNPDPYEPIFGKYILTTEKRDGKMVHVWCIPDPDNKELVKITRVEEI